MFRKFAPRCHGCGQPIGPKVGESSATRLTALDKDWHPECFKCKDCGLILNSAEGKKCYPQERRTFMFGMQPEKRMKKNPLIQDYISDLLF